MSEYMIFCLGTGESSGEGYQKSYRVFNKDVSKDDYNKILSSLSGVNILLTAWIYEKNMTDDEKDNVNGWSEMGGYLKTFSYQDAWANFWAIATQETKNKILDIKQFDATIFKGITGIDVSRSESLSGKTVKVEIDGKKYEATIK